MFKKYQHLLLVKIRLMKWEPYEEKYFFLLTDIWEIEDNIKGYNGPSDWKVKTEGLNKHNIAIT
jgi:hypothetical protein